MDGIERLKVLSAEVKDEAVIEIVNYLLSRKDMNTKYLDESKSLKNMIDFIKNEAKKISKNNIAMVKDEIVFNWAIHYWDEPNEKLDIPIGDCKNKQPILETNIKNKEHKKEWVPEGQITLFDVCI